MTIPFVRTFSTSLQVKEKEGGGGVGFADDGCGILLTEADLICPRVPFPESEDREKERGEGRDSSSGKGEKSERERVSEGEERE